MPVEIRELNIKINLSDDGGSAGHAASGGTEQETQQALIEAVVDKVMALLREQQER